MSTVTVPKSGRGPARRPAAGVLASWVAPLRSSVGRKYVVAVTGIVLVGFVVGHMAGNAQVFAGLTPFGGPEHGQEAINGYAEFLKSKPALLWAARLFLLAAFVLHLVVALQLNRENRRARPVPYAYEDTIQASWASRHMTSTGIVVGLFLLFHLAHYTLGVVKGATVHPFVEDKVQRELTLREEPVKVNYLDLKDEKGRHNVYAMTVYGFRNPWITLTYVLAQVALFFHLSHGTASVFQTLGLNRGRTYPVVGKIGLTVALVVGGVNIAMPLTVYLGYLEPGMVYFPGGIDPAFPKGGVGQ